MIHLKKINKLFSILTAFCLFIACSEDRPIESEITYFPTFEYEDFVVVEVGSSYTPQATATEDGQNLEVVTSSNVNTSVVGVYDVAFSATNSNGFDAVANQTVVVHDPSIIGTDVSGAIQDTGRPERTGVISLIPGTTSIFYATDFGFGGTFPVYFQMDGDIISEIPQTYVFSATGVDLTYDPVSMQFTTLISPYGFGYTFEYQN